MKPDKQPDAPGAESRWKGIPQTIWALGFVSMFMDISSEMIHSLLPVFLVSVLGASALSVGIIEGVAEATALITKTFSGALSDRLRKRKALILTGYALGTLTKPLFAAATGSGLVFTARFLDRIGKGIRGAPRDALIADVTPGDLRGTAYGLRQSLDTAGAFLGPLLAMVLMIWTSGDFRSVFWLATVPGLLSVVILAFYVSEPVVSFTGSLKFPLHRKNLREMGCSYWLAVLFGCLFTLARFSEAFLLLRATSVGMKASMVPALMVLMNVVYSLTAYPVGRLSDRIGRTGMMAVGLVVLIASDLIFAVANASWVVAAGTALWGLHMGLTQGLLSAMIADNARQDLRGTAFGIFSLASGVATLLASIFAGWLWEGFGAPATFIAGATIATAALIGFMVLRRLLLR
jgi:MFS family permease